MLHMDKIYRILNPKWLASKTTGFFKCIGDNGIRYTAVHFVEKAKRFYHGDSYGLVLIKRKTPVVVTLTSYPARIKTVSQGIQTLLSQSVKPDRVVLWLAKPQFPGGRKDLPEDLLALEKRGLSIRWCKDDMKSYKKIIPALKAFPRAILITADDDLLYEKNWLELLLKSYARYDRDINIHRATKLYWHDGRFLTSPGGKFFYPGANAMNKLCGGAGAVFPPGCFHRDVCRRDIFEKLAPTSDDIWLWAMAVLNGWRVRVVEGHQSLRYIPGSQETALWKINDTGAVPMFSQHLANICNFYPEFKSRLVADFQATARETAADGFNLPAAPVAKAEEPASRVAVLSASVDGLKKALQDERTAKDNAVRQLQSLCRSLYADARYMIYKYLPAEKREEALKDWWWKAKAGRSIDLDNPQTFDEKIQWLKLHGDDPLLSKLADKYEVREWVAERIGKKYLVPLIGVWDSADDINFDELPDRFALKANHGCGWNVIVKDKSKINVQDVRNRVNRWLKTCYSFVGSFEMQYRGIKPRVIAEEYMENAGGDIYDYKFWCFKGRCHYVQFLSERQKHLKMVFFDRDWNVMPFVYDHPRNENPPPRPDNLDEMMSLAEKLAQGFEYVRVDFYRLNDGTVRFGEMTFTSANGQCKWDPPEWDLKIGQMFDVRPGNRT